MNKDTNELLFLG